MIIASDFQVAFAQALLQAVATGRRQRVGKQALYPRWPLYSVGRACWTVREVSA